MWFYLKDVIYREIMQKVDIAIENFEAQTNYVVTNFNQSEIEMLKRLLNKNGFNVKQIYNPNDINREVHEDTMLIISGWIEEPKK
jgi:hypothetical protein